MSEQKIVTPKFLTTKVATQATKTVLAAVIDPYTFGYIGHVACHIVVLAPALIDEYPDSVNWPKAPLQPCNIYEFSLNKGPEWTASYDEIARGKALQCWHNQNDDRTDIMPHLLFPGNTPLWGAVKRNGIVVACSGFEAWFDKMISGMIADICIALAYDAWMKSEDKKDAGVFLT